MAHLADESWRHDWNLAATLGDPMSIEPQTNSLTKKKKPARDLREPVDLARIESAVREILLAIGEDPDREGLRETPQRVARMYDEMFSGLRKDPAVVLRKTFTEKYDEMVLVKNIGFESMCEHHLLPFFGKAHIAYLPNGHIVGLSKLARIVEIFSRRPQVQERMTQELADLVMQELDARGVGVVVEATHTCMAIRGVRKVESLCTTSAMRGVFQSNLSTRSEFMALIQTGK
jgi:GTP cyclohydrolase I